VTDAEASAATEALARLIRRRDTAMADGGDYADPEVFAAECVTVMRGFGWRHSEALAPPKPAPAPAPAAAGSSREEQLRSLRAQLDELNAAKRAPFEAVDGAA
jgi:hypothetical protein